jgi:hypothetical protein
VTSRRSIAISIATATLLSACATTIDDGATPTEATPATSLEATVEPAPSGTPDELLAEMATAMSRLSSEVAEDGDAEQRTLADIEAIWVVLRPQVDATHPELVNGFDTTVDMAGTAVRRVRPADADKAYALFVDLAGRYTDDG